MAYVVVGRDGEDKWVEAVYLDGAAAATAAELLDNAWLMANPGEPRGVFHGGPWWEVVEVPLHVSSGVPQQ